MYRTLFFLTLFLVGGALKAQRDTFTCVFEPECITYNASDKPGQCVEAVDCGIIIKDGKFERFFLLPAREYESLKTEMRGKQISVEVVYFDDLTHGSSAAGNVEQIIFEGKVIFKNFE